MRYPPLEPPFNQRISAGFTLVEIAIVLVIIELIIGGIMVGGEMIHSATLRRVVSEKNPYEAAIRTFQLKYGHLPLFNWAVVEIRAKWFSGE